MRDEGCVSNTDAVIGVFADGFSCGVSGVFEDFLGEEVEGHDGAAVREFFVFWG